MKKCIVSLNQPSWKLQKCQKIETFFIGQVFSLSQLDHNSCLLFLKWTKTQKQNTVCTERREKKNFFQGFWIYCRRIYCISTQVDESVAFTSGNTAKFQISAKLCLISWGYWWTKIREFTFIEYVVVKMRDIWKMCRNEMVWNIKRPRSYQT